MKRLLLLFLLAPVAALAISRSVSISAPSQVTTGQSFLVPTSASTDASDGEQIGFYHAEYSTDNGASWTGFCYDVNVGGAATRNAWITAGGAGSTIIVRVKIAFRGGNAGDVDYDGNALDWGGSWDNWQTPPTKYASISVVAPPNQPPTIAWVQNPASAYVNQFFVMQARGNDADGNLMNVWVWKEWVPFAVNGGGNGYQNYSDANGTAGTAPGWINFQAQAFDTANAASSVIYHGVQIVNRAPGPLNITLSGNTVAWDSANGHYTMWTDNAVTVTSTLQDPDGNLVNHTLRYQKITGAGPDDNAWTILGNNTPSGGYSSTKTSVLSNLTPGRWDFSSFGHDGYLSHPGDAKTVWVYGPTNGAQFVSQSVSSAPMEIGSTRTVSVTFKNSGDKPWTTDGTPHQLGSQSPADNTRWGLNRVGLASGETIVPGAQKVFTFTITAPSTPNTYAFQWQMLEDGFGTFGDMSTPVQIQVVDTTAPSVPLNLQLVSKTHNAVTLSWTPSSDNSGTVVGYRVYRNGAQVGTTSSVTFTDTGLSANTTYSYTVRAYDSVPNVSNASGSLAVTTNSDPNADDDGDGIPNWWELQYFGSATAADPNGDFDSDGMSNLAEFNAGTDPKVANASTATLGGAPIAGWPNAASGSSNAVGTTTGTLQVDKNGAATYSIPIWTTPGTAGMQPQITLNYSSQAGTGIAGFGWSLGGISAITRGPQTLAIDGKFRGANLTLEDRFYLDGQRLILISGDYGSAGSEYRTDPDTFTKVVANGQTGNGPASFTAWTKSGLKIFFGATDDSAFNPGGGSTVHSWHVSKIEDTLGNYMEFHYDEDTINGTQLLKHIDYTGNGSTQPYASLRFEYESRPDYVKGFFAGVPMGTLYRLKKIQSFCSIPPYETNLARTYTLNYDERPYTLRSMLSRITETGADGSSYPDLTFEYNGSEAGWNENNAWLPPYYLADNMNDGRPSGTGFIDFDADGRVDFIARRDGAGINLAKRNTGTGWEDATAFLLPYRLANQANGDDQGGRFVDVNADGRVDFLFRKQGAGGEIQASGAYLNTPGGWVYDSTWEPPAVIARDSYPERGGRFVDVNGDGRVDFVASHGTGNYKVWVYLNTGSGWSFDPGYSSIYVPTNDVLANYRPHFIDINGDGLVDIVAHFHGGGSILLKQTWLNTGSGWTLAPTTYQAPEILDSIEQKAAGSEFADVNADGLPDIIWYREMNGSVRQGVAINTGTQFLQTQGYESFQPPHPLSRDGSFNAGSASLDLNADGLPDFVLSRQFTGLPPERSFHYGTGRGWYSTRPQAEDQHELPYLLLQHGVSQTGADFVDLNGDGVVDAVWYRRHANGSDFGSVQINNASPISDRLKKVTNGFQVSAEITYGSLMDSTVYTRGSGGPGQVNVIGPMWVVKSIKNDDGATGAVTTYSYAGLRTDRVYGSLGFEKVITTDTSSGIVSETAFAQEYPYIGMPIRQTTKNGAVVLSDTLTTYDQKKFNSDKTRFIFAADSDATTRDLNGADISTVATTVAATDIDDFGNVKKVTIVTNPGGFAKVTESDYDNDPVNWYLGRLKTSKVTSKVGGKPDVVRNSSFSYYPANGLLKEEVVEPDVAELRLKTSYEYDAFGNKRKVTVSGNTVTVDPATGAYAVSVTQVERITETAYDSRGRFPSWTKNALGHQENYTAYDEARGVLTAMTGANELPTSWSYDGFGRKTHEHRADGTDSDISYKWAAAGAPVGSLYFVETASTGVAPSLAFYDKFARQIHSVGVSGDGRIVYQTTAYDSRNRVRAKSTPYFSSTGAVSAPETSGNVEVYWTKTTTFDDLDRPVVVTTPDDQNGTQISSYTYNGLETLATDPKSRVARTVKNAQGWTISNTRNHGGAAGTPVSTVSYDYDAIGNLTATDADGIVTSLAYDLRGRKTSMTDADMGTWQYRYNAFGELIWQKDAKGQVVTMVYDALGRMTSRTEPEGTTTWTYDTAARGASTWKGKLALVSSPGGYSESYVYDSVGRPSSVTRTIDGTPYTVATEYDSAGRVNRTTYPASVASLQPVSTRNVYNQFGYLKEIRNWLDEDSSRSLTQLQGLVYWRVADGTSLPSYSADGHIEAEVYGNGLANDRYYSRTTGRLLSANIDAGRVAAAPYRVQQLTYSYDAVGNVTRRNDQTPGVERDEQFYTTTPGDGYDALDRLLVHRVVGGSTVTVTYAANGNIAFKSDVGAYAYGTQPHAVTSAGVNSYSYDAVGNMLTGAGRDFAWTSFNQMRWVKNSAGLSSEFSFGAGHERVKQVRRTGTTSNNGALSGTVTDTTIYIGALYERVITAATNTVEHKHYILAPTGRIAAVTRSTVNGVIQANTTRYFHTDGLGSITVVSDEAGRVLKRYAYDAWGKQSTRYTNTTSGITNQAPTTRGFTDHEMLSDFGLIHMNGRVYDPTLGRFLSADPYVDDAGDSQSYNRYSYVSNNPLNHTDPSGYFKLKDALKIVAVIVISVVTYGAASGAAMAGMTATAATATTAATYSIGGIAISASTAGVIAGVAGGAAAGFASGFSGSLLNGGSVGDAFKSGVIGAGIGAVTGGIAGKLGIGGIPKDAGEYFRQLATVSAMGGVAGGVSAELQGGKFRHGFRTGAIYGAAGYVAFTGLNTYLHEQGETLFPQGGSQDPAAYDQVTTNGIMGDRAAMQTRVDTANVPTVGYFNPSQGIINDVMQSFWQKIAFGYGDSLAAGFSRLTSQMAPGPLSITAHSQGTLTVTNAILQGGVPRGSTLNLRSPAISYPRAWLAGRINGGTMNYIQPWGDGANLWAPSLNPLKYASGLADIFARAKIHTGNYP